MKTTVITSPNVESSEMNVSVVGMSTKGMDVAAYFMRDKIYSNKILAPIRENISNAIDEHRKHNIACDVVVKLYPTNEGGYIWSVRDFAKGLDDDGVRKIFGMYFESTKCDSDLFIGGFGVGAKSFNCYSDEFYVSSYFGGFKTTYAFIIGGGVSGTPVAHIYEVEKIPSDETGLEVFCDVTKDVSNFSITTSKFVKYLSGDVNLTFFDGSVGDGVNPIRPLTPIATKMMEDVTFNLYESKPATFKHIKLRMGGIIYNLPDSYSLITNNDLNGDYVIDIPMGAMSIPISRELFEVNEKNANYISKVGALFNDLRAEDINILRSKRMSLSEYLKFTVEEGSNTRDYIGRATGYVPGVWITVPLRDIYNDYTSLIKYITVNRRFTKSGTTAPLTVGDDGYTCYVIPSNSAKKRWIDRLRTFIGDAETILLISSSEYEYMCKDMGGEQPPIKGLKFVSVKTLKLPNPKSPKVAEVEKSYKLIYGRVKKTYTLSEFKVATQSNFHDKAEWWKSPDISLDVLHARTIAFGKDNNYGYLPGTGWVSYWKTSSKDMFDFAISIGFITPYSDEYKMARAIIKERCENEAREESIIHQLKSYTFNVDINPKIISYIFKNPSKINRYEKVYDHIMSSQTTRCKILKQTLVSYNELKLTREELRQVLKLS